MHIWESENHFNLEVTELTDASCVSEFRIQNFIFEVSYFVRRGKLKQTIYRVLLQHDCIQHLLGLQNHLSKFRSLSPSQHSPLSQIPKEGLSLAFWLESHNTFTLNFKNAKFSAKLNRSSPPSEDLRELSCVLKNPWLIEQKISLNHIKLHNVLLICILCKLSYFLIFEGLLLFLSSLYKSMCPWECDAVYYVFSVITHSHHGPGTRSSLASSRHRFIRGNKHGTLIGWQRL